MSDTRLSMHAAGRDICLRRLSEVLPPGCRVSILADRGFGDHKLFAYLADLGFAYVIRLRGNIHVTDASGETRTAANWVGRSGRARKLHAARVTASHAGSPYVSVVKLANDPSRSVIQGSGFGTMVRSTCAMGHTV